jgi:hypothetical protein
MARLGVLAVLLLACGPASSLPPVVELGGTALAAASCGVRQTLWIEHYSAVLYLPRRAPPQEELVDPLSPKALELAIIDSRFLTLAYAADQGVTLKVNGNLVAKAAGHSLVDAILETWADNEPMRPKLRRILARNACRADRVAGL